MNKPSFYKSHITSLNSDYKGGKSRSEVTTGKKIYKMSSNENPIGPSPKALAAIRKFLSEIHEYPERTGASLNKALSEYYLDELQPQNFVTANSGIGIIELIINAFLGEGTQCIISNPAFKPYSKFAEKTGTTIVDIPLKGDNFDLDVTGILNAINEKTRVIWLCSPHNPTGAFITKQQMNDIVLAVPDHVVVVYDEVYYHFVDVDTYTTAMPFVLSGHNVISINSFAKAYGLAGLRCGYAYAKEEIANYLNVFRRPFYLNTLTLEGAKAALSDTDHLAQTIEIVKTGKQFMYESLGQLKIKYWESQTNFIMIDPAMDEKIFESKMLDYGVMIRPLGSFGLQGKIRVTIGGRAANRAFIHALKRIL